MHLKYAQLLYCFKNASGLQIASKLRVLKSEFYLHLKSTHQFKQNTTKPDMITSNNLIA